MLENLENKLWILTVDQDINFYNTMETSGNHVMSMYMYLLGIHFSDITLYARQQKAW